MEYVGSDNSGLGIGMDLFWTTLDYVGSDNSGLGSVWNYSEPTWIMLDQIILVWDQYGFILDHYGLCWIR